jgi:aminoglycoside 3-N-acetyltransferase
MTLLSDDLRALGVRAGQDLLIHASLRRIGADPATVLAALRRAAGPEATLVVPAQTPMSSPTSRAYQEATAGLDARQAEQLIAGLPGFDPASTPSQGMGAFAEHLRTRPGAHRSTHPLTSFAALGPRAAACTARHDLDCHLGEHSPLGWLYEQDAAILLLGVGYSVCTAFHLAEYRRPTTRRQYRCLVSDRGIRQEVEFIGIVLDDEDFALLGRHIDREPFVRRHRTAGAESRLLPIRPAVDFAVAWMEANRPSANS